MEKDKLIGLMKNYKINKSRMKLKEKEREKIELELAHINSNVVLSSSYGVNNDIRPKNKISDKVANKVINDEKQKDYLKEKIEVLDAEIYTLKDSVEQVDFRLECLHEDKRKIIEAYYLEGKTAEDIGDRLFLDLYRRTCSINGVYKIINRCISIMCNL